MRNKLSMAAAAFFVVAVAVAVVMAQARATRTVWEYKEIELAETTVATPLLNREGGDGWELVNVVSSCVLTQAGTQYENPKSKCRYFAYLKRVR